MQKLENLSVLILAYNRFEKFNRCIKRLNEQGIKKIYLSIDGPRNKNDLKNQEKITSFCKNNNFDMDIIINQFHHNYGCRLGPIKGISWFFSHNQYGIILEDDIILSKKCIEAFSYLLDKYFYNDEFLSITSFNELSNSSIENIYSMPLWRSFGWASWAHKWESHISFSKKIRYFNMWDLYKLMPKDFRSIETVKLVKASQLNLLDAWDYEFNFSHLVNMKKSLTLGGINCLNYGFDDSATHTTNLDAVGIDFKLFNEKEIDLKNIMQFENNKLIPIFNKCGFNFNKSFTFNKNLFDFLKFIFFSFIFYLRIIKRIMNKTL